MGMKYIKVKSDMGKNDNEYRKEVLQYLYDHKGENKKRMNTIRTAKELNLPHGTVLRIGEQLVELNMVRWIGEGFIGSCEREYSISARGIDEIEVPAQSQPATSVTNTTTINTGASQGSQQITVGENNSTNVNGDIIINIGITELMDKIASSNATPAVKEEAKGILQNMLGNQLIGQMVGGVVSGVTGGLLM